MGNGSGCSAGACSTTSIFSSSKSNFGRLSSAFAVFRFFVVAWLLQRYGAPMRAFIEKNLNILFTLFMVLLIGGFVVFAKLF